MRRTLKTLIATSALVAGIAIAPALYAQSTETTPGAQVLAAGQDNMPCQVNMTGRGGMSGQYGMGQGHGGMMGQGNMMGRGGMTGQYGMGQGHGGMMGQGGTAGQGHGGMSPQGNITGQGNMGGMMGQMAQMAQLMDTHNKMMETMMKAHGAAPSVTK